MTRAEAHELLDAAKAGVEVSRRAIVDALRVTGDLAPAWHASPAREQTRYVEVVTRPVRVPGVAGEAVR